MVTKNFLMITGLALALVIGGCGSPNDLGYYCDGEDEVCFSDDAKEDGFGSSAKSVIIDESGDGDTFAVTVGQKVIVRLSAVMPEFEWQVKSTDRTFGYPTVKNITDSTTVGGETIQQFTWKTAGTYSVTGKHKVVLAYRNKFYTDDHAEREFTFTVNITEQLKAVVIEESGNGKTFTVTEGQDVIVRLSTNPSTGYEWKVKTTDRTFGYPDSSDIKDVSDNIGGSATQEFTWKTDGPLSMVGTHKVVLEYARSWEEGSAEDAFTFTVRIKSAI